MAERTGKGDEDFAAGLSAPARRALDGAGYASVEQLAKADASEVAELHGMGPKAMGQLRRLLAARGLSFADENLK